MTDMLLAKSGRSYVTIKERHDGKCRVECVWIVGFDFNPTGERVADAFVADNIRQAKRLAKDWLVGDGDIEWSRIGAFGHVYAERNLEARS